MNRDDFLNHFVLQGWDLEKVHERYYSLGGKDEKRIVVRDYGLQYYSDYEQKRFPGCTIVYSRIHREKAKICSLVLKDNPFANENYKEIVEQIEKHMESSGGN